MVVLTGAFVFCKEFEGEVPSLFRKVEEVNGVEWKEDCKLGEGRHMDEPIGKPFRRPGWSFCDRRGDGRLFSLTRKTPRRICW